MSSCKELKITVIFHRFWHNLYVLLAKIAMTTLPRSIVTTDYFKMAAATPVNWIIKNLSDDWAASDPATRNDTISTFLRYPVGHGQLHLYGELRNQSEA